MSEFEIAHALTDLSDELLLEAQQPQRQAAPGRLRKLVVAVAAVAALVATVGAATVGITWSIAPEPETIEGAANSYYKDDDGVLDFEKLEYAIPLEVVELPQQKLGQLRGVLQRHWSLVQQEEYRRYDAWTQQTPFTYDSHVVDAYMESYLTAYGTSLDYQPAFSSLEEVEAMLGIELAVPRELRDAICAACEQRSSYGLSVRVNTGKSMGEVAQENGVAEPTKVIINFQLDRFDGCTRINGVIHIPLTEEAAREGVQGLYYSYEKEGLIWQEERLVDGRDVTLFGNDPEQGYAGWSKAIYTEAGAAYIITARVEPVNSGQSPDNGRQTLLSLLSETE